MKKTVYQLMKEQVATMSREELEECLIGMNIIVTLDTSLLHIASVLVPGADSSVAQCIPKAIEWYDTIAATIVGTRVAEKKETLRREQERN
jgi:hypothetical protein